MDGCRWHIRGRTVHHAAGARLPGDHARASDLLRTAAADAKFSVWPHYCRRLSAGWLANLCRQPRHRMTLRAAESKSFACWRSVTPATLISHWFSIPASIPLQHCPQHRPEPAAPTRQAAGCTCGAVCTAAAEPRHHFWAEAARFNAPPLPGVSSDPAIPLLRRSAHGLGIWQALTDLPDREKTIIAQTSCYR